MQKLSVKRDVSSPFTPDSLSNKDDLIKKMTEYVNELTENQHTSDEFTPMNWGLSQKFTQKYFDADSPDCPFSLYSTILQNSLMMSKIQSSPEPNKKEEPSVPKVEVQHQPLMMILDNGQN